MCLTVCKEGTEFPLALQTGRKQAGGFDLIREAVLCTCHGKVESLDPEAVGVLELFTSYLPLLIDTDSKLRTFFSFHNLQVCLTFFKIDQCQTPQSIFRTKVSCMLLPLNAVLTK